MAEFIEISLLMRPEVATVDTLETLSRETLAAFGETKVYTMLFADGIRDYFEMEFSISFPEATQWGSVSEIWSFLTRIVDRLFSLVEIEFAFISIELNSFVLERITRLSMVDPALLLEMSLSFASLKRSLEISANWVPLSSCTMFINPLAKQWWQDTIMNYPQ
jgi:hypothetical protein